MTQGRLARWSALTSVVLGLAAAPVVADAATLHVAANGVDAAGCGPATTRCRSIGRAVANATPGDTLVVGPGRYPPATVDKRLRLMSARGAATTVIDADGGDFALRVLADGVTIGSPGRGFTVSGGLLFGIEAANVSEVTITGNHVLGNRTGISVSGEDIQVSGNVVSRNYIGIYGEIEGGGAIVGNLVQDNELWGISGHLPGGTIRGNAVTGNWIGIYASFGSSGGVVRDNTTISNDNGMMLSGSVLVVRNSVLSSRYAGLFATNDHGVPTVTGNNFYDNNWAAPAGQRCAIWPEPPSSHIDARNNFWGTPTGPGSTEPADAVCHGTVETVPFRRTEISVNPIKPRL